MSALRKMGVYLGLVEDADRYDGYDDGYEDYDAVEDERTDTVGAVDRGRTDRAEYRPEDEGGTVRTLPRRRVAEAVEVRDMNRITNLTPRSYNDAREVGEHFRDGVPVIMNLTQMDDGDAKRLVDFAAGLIFGCRGSIERVTAKVFLLSPADLEVTAEDKARIVRGDFFNQS